MTERVARLRALPLTEGRWPDLEALFGERGACSGCWCMYWRIPRARFMAQAGKGNRAAFRRIVARGEKPGLLAYRGREPVGWVAVGPRATYPTLERSRILRSIDNQEVWSITCFFVGPQHRGQGVAGALVEAALAHARKKGARTVEAYPTEPRGRKLAAVSSYRGTPSLFRKAGFREVARPSAVRVVMRKSLRGRESDQG